MRTHSANLRLGTRFIDGWGGATATHEGGGTMATTTQLTEAGTSKYAQAGDIRVHYNEEGTGDAVIFLHGGGPGASSWSNYARNVGPLSENYRCLLVDQPGYGKTDSVVINEPRATVNARAVKELMDTLNIDKATLVGNSMGGATALAFAVDYNDRLEKMVLMGSGAGGINIFEHTPSEGIKILNAVFDNPTLEGFRELINVMLYDGSQVPDSLLKERYETTMANPGHLEARKKSTGAFSRDLMADLTNVKTPSLIIHGRNDRVVAPEGSMRLLSTLENSNLVIFNKCGHWAQFEHADLFNRLVADFLAH